MPRLGCVVETIENALYVVATPIGHLGDMTYRAVHVLQHVDLIAAEDTRTTSVLLNHYGVRTAMKAYHARNAARQTAALIAHLQGGKSLALVSDAGTPTISDPGFQLVKAATEAGIRVIPVPGASAVLAALMAGGLPTHSFAFEGFLPQKKGRQSKIKMLAEEARTLVFYESPHRIHKTVGQLLEVWGDRPCVLGREITKKFEEFFYGSLQQLHNHLEARTVKGELVLLVGGAEKKRKENR